MTPSIQPKDATLGAVVTNIDLAHLNDPTWSIVEDAFIEYGVLIFPGQHLDDDEQVAFMSRFGDLEIVLTHISNVGSDNRVISDDEVRYWILRGNEQWHIDSSFKPLSAKASCLSAITAPEAGGTHNGPICAPPTMHWMTRPGAGSRVLAPCTRSTTRTRCSDSRHTRETSMAFMFTARRCDR
jgi:hypothetical protein